MLWPQRGPGKQSSAAQSIIAKQQHAKEEKRVLKKDMNVFAGTIGKRCLSFVAKLSWLEHLQHLDHFVRLEKRAAAGWFASGNHLLRTGSRYLQLPCVCPACSVPSTLAMVSGLVQSQKVSLHSAPIPEKIHCGGEPPGLVSVA